MVYRGPAGWQKTGSNTISPRPSGNPPSIQADVTADDINLGDDDSLDFGDADDYALQYNTTPATNRFELLDPNDERAWSVDDGRRVVRFEAGSLNVRTVPAGETYTVQSDESLVIGELTVDGTLDVDGTLTDTIGPITGSGSITGDGTVKVVG